MPEPNPIPDPNRWVFKREFSIGDMLAFIFAGGSILLAYGKLDTRTTVLENFRSIQEKRDDGQDIALQASVVEIKNYLYRIEDKVDKLREARNGKP